MVYLIDNSTYSKVLLVYSTPIKNYLLQLFLKELYKLLFKSFFLAISVSLTITSEVSVDFLSYWYYNVLLPNVITPKRI